MIKILCTAINQIQLRIENPIREQRRKFRDKNTILQDTDNFRVFQDKSTKFQDSYGPGQRDGDRSFNELN